MAELRTPNIFILSDLASLGPLPETGQAVRIVVPDEFLSDERFEAPGVEGLAIQRLITDAENFQQRIYADRRVPSDKIENAMMHPC